MLLQKEMAIKSAKALLNSFATGKKLPAHVYSEKVLSMLALCGGLRRFATDSYTDEDLLNTITLLESAITVLQKEKTDLYTQVRSSFDVAAWWGSALADGLEAEDAMILLWNADDLGLAIATGFRFSPDRPWGRLAGIYESFVEQMEMDNTFREATILCLCDTLVRKFKVYKELQTQDPALAETIEIFHFLDGSSEVCSECATCPHRTECRSGNGGRSEGTDEE